MAGNPNWKKGNTGALSGNPTGKRTGARAQIAEIIDRVCSPSAEEEIKILGLMARGIMKDPHIPGAFIRVPAVVAKECALWIVDQRHGKAKQSVDVDLSGSIEHESRVDLGRLTQSELGGLERLLEKGAVDQVSEGEIVEAKALPEALTDSQNVPIPRPTVDFPIQPVLSDRKY